MQGEENLESVKHATVLKHTLHSIPIYQAKRIDEENELVSNTFLGRKKNDVITTVKGELSFFLKLAYLYLLS